MKLVLVFAREVAGLDEAALEQADNGDNRLFAIPRLTIASTLPAAPEIRTEPGSDRAVAMERRP